MAPNRLRSAPRLAGPLLLALLLSALAPGCAAPPTGDGATDASGPGASAGRAAPAGSDALGRAIASYEAGAYREALRTARPVTARPGPEQLQAAYVAGIASLQLEDLEGAATQLERARRAEDSVLSARATAALGLVRLAQHRPREAAELFSVAALDLDGADRADAMAAARTARLRAGLPVAPASAGTVAAGRYTLQVGAFSTRARAEQARHGAEPDAAHAGLGRPLLAVREDGRRGRLYLVQVGSFETRNEAAAVRNRHGLSEWLVTQIRQGT